MSASTKTTSIAPPHARFLVAIIDGSAARLLGVALQIRLILLTECVTHAKLTLGLKIILFSADSGKDVTRAQRDDCRNTGFAGGDTSSGEMGSSSPFASSSP